MQTSFKKHTGFFSRVLEIINYKGISSVNDFAINYLNYSAPQKINRLKNEGTSPSFNIIKDIVNKFEDINPEWLITGKGPMLRHNQEILYKKPPFLNTDECSIVEIIPKAGKPNTLIADIKTSTSFGNIMHDHKALEQLPSILLPNAPFGLNIAFQILGDSMRPGIRHLDFVAANQLNAIEDIRDGHTYVIIDKNDGVICKRIYKLEQEESIQIKSDNPNYPPYTRSFDYILGVFKCFMRLSTDFRTYSDDICNTVQELRTDIRQIKQQLYRQN